MNAHRQVFGCFFAIRQTGYHINDAVRATVAELACKSNTVEWRRSVIAISFVIGIAPKVNPSKQFISFQRSGVDTDLYITPVTELVFSLYVIAIPC